jgi:AcrR family transcriptional regulator
MPSRAPETKASRGRERAEHLGPERRRPMVLDAALRLFVEGGYRGTSMEAIATAAGVTKPVVYDCYPSKEELFRALLEREESRLLAAIGGALPTDINPRDVEGALASGFEAIFTAAIAAPDSWRVLFESEHGAERAVARRARAGRRLVVDQLAGLVEPVLAEVSPDATPGAAPVLAELVVSVGEAGVRILLAKGDRWTPEELSALMARVAVRGFAAA